jgi:hypothetical protein
MFVYSQIVRAPGRTGARFVNPLSYFAALS